MTSEGRATPTVGLYRMPPLNAAGEVDVDGELNGQKRHCDLPYLQPAQCDAIMHDHGWIDGPGDGRIVCPVAASLGPDPDTLADPPGTVRGRQVYPPDMPADIPARPWGLHCDRCVPGAHGERIDVSLPDQLPCEHVS